MPWNQGGNGGSGGGGGGGTPDPNSVGATQIQSNAVTTVKIADLNVTSAKLADAAVTTAKIADGAVATADIADLAVTTIKVADGAITTDKIAAGAVATADIADGAVTLAKVSAALSDGQLLGRAGASLAGFTPGTAFNFNRNVTGGVAGLDANGRLDTATVGTVNDAFDVAVDVTPAFPAAPASNFGRIGVVEWVPQVRDFVVADAAGSLAFVERWFAGATKYSWAASQTAAFNGNGIGIALAALGTFSVPAMDATALGSRQRNRWTSALTNGSYSGPFSGNGSTGVGTARPGQLVGGVRLGGFFHAIEFAYGNDQANTSSFVGLGQSVPGGTATPITRAHHAGLSFEGASAAGSVVRFTRNDSSGTGIAVDLTAGSNGVVATLNRGASTAPLLLSMFMPTEQDILCVRLDRVDGPRNIVPIFRNTFTTQIPGAALTAGLVHETYMRANAAIGAGAIIDVYRVFGFSGG